MIGSNRKFSLFPFLIGLGAQTQIRIVGSMGVSEFVMFMIAPIVFLMDMPLLRKHGFMPAIWLSLLTCAGCLFGGFWNHTDKIELVKGFASPYAIFAIIVCLHRVLWKNLSGMKWLVLGLACSWVLSTFVLQPTYEADMYAEGQTGLEAVEGIMSSPLFLIGRLSAILKAPIQGWYLQTPIIYSVVVPAFLTVLALVSAKGSGRSAALCAFVSVLLILVARKSRSSMAAIGRRVMFYGVLLLVMLYGFKTIYKFTAANGMLGEEARSKYERTTRGKTSALAILMSGRPEFFVGMWAGVKNPIIGYGPRAIDKRGLYRQFLDMFGDDEAVRGYEKAVATNLRYGRTQMHIPMHSHLTMFWNWYGIFGLFFWLYVFRVFYLVLTKCVATIPQWYGYFAMTIPGAMWNIFFSPFAGRVGTTAIIVISLFALAVKRGRLRMPQDVYLESLKADR